MPAPAKGALHALKVKVSPQHRALKSHRQVQTAHRIAQQNEAFEEICRPYIPRIFQTAQRITRNREDAEDAVQDSLLQAYLHLNDFDGRSTFSTWLTRIAINSALMVIRKRRSLRSTSLDALCEPDGPCFEVADTKPHPEQQALRLERQRKVREAAGALRPALRQVLEIHQFDERPMKEAAKLMGISVCAAKGRLFHAKAALRKSRKLKVLKGSVKFVEMRIAPPREALSA